MKKGEKHNFNEFWQPYAGVVDMEDLWDLSKKKLQNGETAWPGRSNGPIFDLCWGDPRCQKGAFKPTIKHSFGEISLNFVAENIVPEPVRREEIFLTFWPSFGAISHQNPSRLRF